MQSISPSARVLAMALCAVLALLWTTPLGAGSGAAAPEKRKIYFTDPVNESVHVYRATFSDPVKLKFVTTITGFSSPWGVAVDPANGAFALVAQRNGELVRVDTANDTISSRYRIGKDLRGVVISQDGTRALVIDHKRKRLKVVNTISGAIEQDLKLKKGKPLDIFRSPSGETAVISHLKKNFITAVRIDELLAGATGTRSARAAVESLRVAKLPKQAYGMGVLDAPDSAGVTRRVVYAPNTSGVGRMTRIDLTSGARSTIQTTVTDAVRTVFPHPYSSDQAGTCVVPAFTLAVGDPGSSARRRGLPDPLPVDEAFEARRAAVYDNRGDDNLGNLDVFDPDELARLFVLFIWTGFLSSERQLAPETIHAGAPRIETFPNGLGMGLTYAATFGEADLPAGAQPLRAALQETTFGPPGCTAS